MTARAHLVVPSLARTEPRLRLALAVFAQMLPATMLGPAIRPLFAARHGGDEGAMHAFMSLGMVGALLVTPLVARWADRGGAERARAAIGTLAALDAVLVLAIGAALPTPLVLALRTIEGGAHVATSTLLLAEAARLDGPRAGAGKALSLGGGALLAAVAAGSLLGGVLARAWLDATFVAAALLLASVACVGPRLVADRPTVPARASASPPWRALARPLAAAFVERFGIGCMVVSFSLFARAQHGLDDASIGGLYALITLPFAALMVPFGRLAPAWRPRALRLGALGYAVSLALVPFVPALALAPVFLLAGVASAALYAPSLRELGERAPEDGRARAMGAFHVAGCLGMLLGPALAGITSALVRRHLPGEAPHQAALLLGAAASLAWLAVDAASSLVRRARS